MAQMQRGWSLGACALLVTACMEPSGPVAVQLGFTKGPGAATAGVAMSPVIAVAIQDASGNTVTRATSVVTLTLGTGPAGGTLAGTVSVAAVNGVATFTNLHIDKAGTGYTIKAAATGLMQATSTAFSVGAGPPSRLVFTVQPRTTMDGDAITPPVEVAAHDAFGNIATGFRDVVTLGLEGPSVAGTLSGLTAVTAVGGYATFGDLSIEPVSAGYTLTANAAGLTGVTSAPFAIAPPTALLRINTTTTGALDADGYAVCVDSSSDGLGGTACAYGGLQTIGVNRTMTLTVDTGAHTVRLTGVAAHCELAADSARAVHASRGETATVRFVVACAQPTFDITTTTTGVSLDPDGYSVCVDPVYRSDWYSDGYYECPASTVAIGVNGAMAVAVGPGTHLVWLLGVAENCDVPAGNPRTVDAGATSSVVQVPFEVTCSGIGSVRITTATSGPDPDADGYTVCIDRSGTCYWYASTHPNDVVTIVGVTAGLHTVTLSGTAGNCTVSGATDRAVTVPVGGVADVTFDVACVRAERIAYSYGGMITVSQLGDFTRLIVPGFAPAWSPNGARLAYECGPNLCAINADGNGLAQLTSDGASNRHPTWSPDGMKIAFAATHGGTPDLYVMAANGSSVVRLAPGVVVLGSPAWSPDGTKIAFDCRVLPGNDDICVVNADGTSPALLTSDPAREYGAAWKPDGSALMFATTRFGTDEIVVMSPVGGSVTRIGAGLPGFSPTWSPDGTQLAFVQTREECGGWWDWTQRPINGGTGSAPVRRADGCSMYDAVYLARSDGSNARVFTRGTNPAWRPHP